MSAGILSLAVAYPETVRTNGYWQKHHPELLANAKTKALGRLWAPGASADLFEQEMAPFVDDPFKGTVERRTLKDGETPLTLEARAARRAVAAAGLQLSDIDLIITSSVFPNQYYAGNAPFLVRELGVECAAFTLESACAGSLLMLRTAAGLVEAKQHKRVLCVTSCNYTQVTDTKNSLGWTAGDGGAAFVVGATPGGFGVLGGKVIPTHSTCAAIYLDLSEGTAKARLRSSETSGRLLKETAEPYLRACVTGALEDAGVRLSDVDFFVFNTPTAWYASFAARALGVDVARTITTYPRYANIGPVLMPSNLYAAARTGAIKPGQLVLLYAVGSTSTAGAVVCRWGDVKLSLDDDPAKAWE